MRPLARYLVTAVTGIVAGLGGAIWTARAGALGSNVTIGAWTTGIDFGSADQSARTRAVVAMRGLLALPAREARYYTAAVDDAGRPLDGRCTYRITGGALPGRWWSLTLYDGAGYLAGPGPYSIESAAIPPERQRRWTILVSPQRQDGAWLPTAELAHFELTLRTYLPPDGGRGNPARDQLPGIRREACE